MYDLIKKAVLDDEAAITISKMDKDVGEVVDAISELSLEELDEKTRREQASRAGIKSGIAKRKAKAVKVTLNDVMSKFLVEQFPLEDKDGLVERIDGQELILRLMRQELAKGGDTAVKLLRVMNDIMQGQPKVSSRLI